MNFPPADSLSPDCSMPVPVSLPAVAPVMDDLALSSKPAVVIAESSVEQARLNWKMQRAALMPQIYLSGGISTNFYKNLSQGQAGLAYGAQMRNNLGEYVSLTLSVPLFSPGGWRSVKRAKADYVIAKLDADDARRKLRDDAEQALADYEGYRKEVERMERKVASDSLAYRLSRRKYEEGMLSTFDIHESAQALLESSVTLLQLRMLLAIRLKLVKYYINNEPLWTLN